ncbi:ubiquitin-conjugating enzyme/RWD-like protein, partial [Scheffersomyces xylosifermentans]|uniref:ubiquitin-conjugating enzyme/RWD-like protein n=1 Tax=Scheffersomyces xylosifermentans TaxID=1304137 RepID=UPI00315D47E2
MAERRLFKEFNQYRKNPPSSSNHQIVSLHPINEDDIFRWEAIIAKPTKADSPYYYQGQWKLDIKVSPTYPISPPTIKFASKICHPNINITDGEICLDILKKDSWSPAWNLEHLLVAILMLLDNPEPDSPLNIDSANLYRYDKVAFESLVQYTMWKYNTFYVGSTSNSMSRDASGIK